MFYRERGVQSGERLRETLRDQLGDRVMNLLVGVTTFEQAFLYSNSQSAFRLNVQQVELCSQLSGKVTSAFKSAAGVFAEICRYKDGLYHDYSHPSCKRGDK